MISSGKLLKLVVALFWKNVFIPELELRVPRWVLFFVAAHMFDKFGSFIT